MKNFGMTIWVMVVIVFVSSNAMAVLFDNGLSNDITNDLYRRDHIEIMDSFLGGITQVNLLPGGRIESADVYENSVINIDGGRIDYGYNEYYIKTHDSSKAYMSGGILFCKVYTYDNSQMTISGGSMRFNLYAYGNSKIYVSGGAVEDTIRAYDNSILTFIGKDFVFGGVEVDYGTFDTMGEAYVNAPLSGLTLAGDPISYDLYFEQGTQVVLIPEPCSIMLLGIGAVTLRRKR